MKGTMHVYYDAEGDFLEFHIGNYRKGYFRDAGEGIVERIDEKTGEITGIGILSFKKRTAKKDLEVKLPHQLEIRSLAKERLAAE